MIKKIILASAIFAQFAISCSKNDTPVVPTDPLTDQVATIYTGINGYVDDIEVENVKNFLVGLREYINTTKPNFKEIINSTKTFTSEAEAILKNAILEYKKSFIKI